MRVGWSRRQRALYVRLGDGSVFAVHGDWWVGELQGFKFRAKWR